MHLSTNFLTAEVAEVRRGFKSFKIKKFFSLRASVTSAVNMFDLYQLRYNNVVL